MSTWKELHDNPRLKEIYIKRLDIIKSIREFFWQQDFLETDTPTALKLPGQEPYLNPLPIEIHNPNKEVSRFFLHTSPEFAMKKLLASGFSKIFQITKCFRDYEEFGGDHNTEFTMIEWYRAPGTMKDFMNDTEALFKFVAKKQDVVSIKYQGKEVDVVKNWDRKSMKEIWQEYIKVNLDEYLDLESLCRLAQNKGYQVNDTDLYEDVFFKIFLNEIEPHLGLERPIFVYNYPTQMCSLSKVCTDDIRYAQRTELYIAGLEIANGFGELLDHQEQKKRLEEDRQLREKLQKETWEVDPDFITALSSGIAEAAGIALGVDRMVMLFTGARNIDEVIFQSIADQLTI